MKHCNVLGCLISDLIWVSVNMEMGGDPGIFSSCQNGILPEGVDGRDKDSCGRKTKR